MKTLTLKYVAAAAFGFAVASPAFAAPGQYPSQQAQQQAQREAQAREAANRANQERLQAELKSKRDQVAWQESVRQERLARSLAEQQRIAKSDPTNSWQYKTVEKAAPVVKGVRDCSFGALGGAKYGYGGMAGGCAAGVAGVGTLSNLKRGATPNQAY